MKSALAPVAALLIGVSMLLTGQGLQGVLLPMRATIEDFSTVAIGVMGGAYFLGFTLGCLQGGELVKRVGHVRVFAAMTAMASAAPLLHGLLLNPVVWSLLRALTGFCFAVLYVVIESWLNDRASNENRGIIFSTYVMITMTVLAAGQLMTLLYDPAQMQLFAIASVLVSMAAIPVALSTSPTPELPHTVRIDLRRLFGISRAGTLACLATGLANGSFWSLAPVFVASVTHDLSLAALFMTSNVVGGAISQWPLGFLSDRIGRRKVLAGLAGTGTIIGIAIVSLGGTADALVLCLLGAAWGMVAFPIYSISVAHANDNADPADYVMVSAGLLLMYGIGAIVGPFIASSLMTFAGGTALYGYTAVIHLVLALYAVARIFRRESVPSDHQIAFSDAIATAHTASHVYEEEWAEEESVPAAAGE